MDDLFKMKKATDVRIIFEKMISQILDMIMASAKDIIYRKL